MKSTNKDQSSYLWKLSFIRDVGLAYNAIYPWNIQLFREKLSEKVHAKIPKGIMGDSEFFVPQRNLKEWQERPWTDVCQS